MPKLVSFVNISLDGKIADGNGGLNWAHHDDEEARTFVADNARSGGRLLFGRRTYEMMASFWPTPAAAQRMPEVARSMNERPKLVVSRTLKEATWSNTTVVRGELLAEVAAMKSGPGTDIAILGSGSLVTQLAAARLIDELQIIVNPVALGGGKSLFESLGEPLLFRLAKTKVFQNGSIFLSYEPIS